MYPSSNNPRYGIFVKNFKIQLESLGFSFEKIVISGRTTNKILLMFIYLKFFIFGIIKILFTPQDQTIYVHYLTHCIPLLLWGILLKKKVIINVHGTDVMTALRIPLLRIISRYILNRITKIVVPSNHFRTLLVNELQLNKDSIYTYPSGGINRSLFTNINSPFSSSSKSIKLVCVSRIDKGKGIETLIDALNSLEINFSCTIIGDGALSKEMMDRTKKLNLDQKVSFTGVLPQKEIVKYLQESDLFIFPTKLNESLGLTGIEAMSCGLPVIGSNSGALPTFINNAFNGFLFTPGDSKELSDKITEFFYSKPEIKNELRKNALFTAEKFDSQNVTKELKKMLMSL